MRGGGATGELMRATNWSATPLGSPDGWPSALKTAVSLMLGARQPVYVAWGPQFISLYNDGYLPIVGTKHPHGFTKPFADLWSEIWTEFRPIVEATMAGEAQHFVDLPIALAGRPDRPVGYFTFSYTALRDDDGAIAGFYCAATETTEKVLAEQRLTEERERQRRMLEQMPGFVALLSGSEHRFEYINDAYREISGDREFIGRTVREVFPDIAGQGFYELLDQVYQTGERFTARALPVNLDRADGHRFIDLTYEPIRNDPGDVTGILAGGYDVTDRVRADGLRALHSQVLELALEDRPLADVLEQLVRAVEDQSHAGVIGSILLLDEDGAHLRHGAAPGLPPEYNAAIDGIAIGVGVGSCGTAAHTKAPVYVSDIDNDPLWADFRELALSHGLRACWSMPILSSQGSVLGTFAMYYRAPREPAAQDLELIEFVARSAALVIERKRAEARIREFNETLEQRVATALAERKVFSDVVDGSTAAVTALDLDYNILAINKSNVDAFARVYGKRPQVGDRFLELLPDMPEHTEQQRALWRRALSGEEFTIVQAFGDPNRDRRHYEVRFNALRDGEGRLIGASSTANDVTDRVQAEQDLETAQEALRQAQKMEAVGQLTGGIAHDFNNLLAAMGGSFSLIERRLADGKSGVDRYISSGQDAVRRAASLTQRLLAFSRRQTLDPVPTDVNKLIVGMEELIRRSVGPTVDIEVVGAVSLWATRVDQPQLESALLNLCINARDAMAPNGGRIIIETANKWLDDRVARERDLKSGQYISLCVTDTGAGMDAETIARAFDPFFTTKPLGQGTGLGLSMVYGFVRQSGGQVRIYSEVGKGTTMCLYLPRYAGEVEDEPFREIDALQQAAVGETILVIDDEPTLRMLMTDVLEEAGYRVLQAATGSEGLRILQSDARIDLLVTDVGLPGGLNGRQVADAARLKRPRLGVLFITGYADNAAIGDGRLEAGMEVITKPFEIASLANKVREMLDR